MITLYHFTADHMVESILADGLIRGMTPISVNGLLAFVPQTQWLTFNADFNQSWNEGSRLPYDRTANRITFEIPIDDKNLIPWTKFKRMIRGHMIKGFDAFGDPDRWYVYQGHLSPLYIKEVIAKGGSQ